MKHPLYFLIFFISPYISQAKDLVDNTLWANILQEHVNLEEHQSQFKYDQMHQSDKDREALKAYIYLLESISFNTFQAATKEAQIAFLINAYNALTIDLILKNYPVDSIKDIGSFFKSPWNTDFFEILGLHKSLNDIENNALRKEYNEPRIHFAIVCASKSCPPLSDTPYTEEDLDSKLDQATKNFLNDPERNYFHAKSNTLYLSKIFNWFSNDFGNVNAFITTHMKLKNSDSNKIREKLIRIKYIDYNWQINAY